MKTNRILLCCSVLFLLLSMEPLHANFLSRAIMAGLPSVTVIHGKGTGVLRTAVQQHLRKNKRVKSVRSGVYGEGEQGVTIVELR